MNKVEKLSFKGKDIILIDLSNCQPEDGLLVIHEAQTIISKMPLKSALILTDVTEAVYNQAVANAIKDFVKANTPHVKASAVIGATGVRQILLNTAIFITRRELKTFETRQQALEWLSSLS